MKKLLNYNLFLYEYGVSFWILAFASNVVKNDFKETSLTYELQNVVL